MIDAFDNRDKALYQALAGGVTSELLLHGSANSYPSVSKAADCECHRRASDSPHWRTSCPS
jgi:hypothetical protein